MSTTDPDAAGAAPEDEEAATTETLDPPTSPAPKPGDPAQPDKKTWQ